LPAEVKDLLRDRKRQDLLRMSRKLNSRDLDLTVQIINILIQKTPLEALRLAEPEPEYLDMEEEKKKDLISKIEILLHGSPRVLSSQEDWLRQTLKIALEILKKSLS